MFTTMEVAKAISYTMCCQYTCIIIYVNLCSKLKSAGNSIDGGKKGYKIICAAK